MTAPDPLTPRQARIFAAVVFVCAGSRLAAIARSPWEWDEVQFLLAMRDYDVTSHQPHPPGFPVYIALGRLVSLLIVSDFRALQAINLVAAMLVFPAVFFFAREVGVRFRTAVIAGALFAFLPNVWFFGGTAFSDVPSVVLVLFAVTLLLRGARSRRDHWLGALLLAIAIGIRPQNILVGLFPGVYASRYRRAPEIAVALVIGVVVIAAAFGGAMYATGSYSEYASAVRDHAEYIARYDSWRSPDRPPMWRLTDRFFLRQYQWPPLSLLTSIVVFVSIIGAVRSRDRAMLRNALTFLPFAIFAWATLDRFSISRFSIAYQPMFALFAADGIRRLARGRDRVEIAAATALIVMFAAFTFTALAPVRNEVAPPIAAVRAVAVHVDPREADLLVGHTMTRFVDYALPRFPFVRVIDETGMPLDDSRSAWILAERKKTPAEGLLFERDREGLWYIARRHYFEVKLAPLRHQPLFREGWYGVERDGGGTWRWMGSESKMLLPPAWGRTRLLLTFEVPEELIAQRAAVTVRVNGEVVERFQPSETPLNRRYVVLPAAAGEANVLDLAIDRTVRHPGDPRDLGLRLRHLGWGPA